MIDEWHLPKFGRSLIVTHSFLAFELNQLDPWCSTKCNWDQSLSWSWHSPTPIRNCRLLAISLWACAWILALPLDIKASFLPLKDLQASSNPSSMMIYSMSPFLGHAVPVRQPLEPPWDNIKLKSRASIGRNKKKYEGLVKDSLDQ